MIDWFEWRTQEREVGREIDWRLAGDPALGRALIEPVPDGWLAFAPTGSAAGRRLRWCGRRRAPAAR